MRIGILQCDDVLERFQPRFGNYPAMFQALLSSVDAGLEFEVYRAHQGQLPTDTVECHAYITTGSRHGVNDDQSWIAQLLEFMREVDRAQQKFVGICFGHQLFAKALGGRVENSDRGWGVGVSFNDMIEQQPWMTPFQEHMDLIVSHQDQVTRLPGNTRVLARSNFCPYYMLQKGSHILTIQGHPEFSAEYSRTLTDSRRNRIEAGCVRQAMTSLQAPVHAELMARWIVNFMRWESGH